VNRSGHLSLLSQSKIQKLIARLESQADISTRVQLQRDIMLLKYLWDADVTPGEAQVCYNEVYFRWRDDVRRGKKPEKEFINKVVL